MDELNRTYMGAPPIQPTNTHAGGGGATGGGGTSINDPLLSFAGVAAHYLLLPRDLCGSLRDLQFAPTPLRMSRLPPVLPPHVRLRPVHAEAGLAPVAASTATSTSAAAGPRFVVEGDTLQHVLPPPHLGRFFLRLLQYIGEEFNPATTCLSAKAGPVPLAYGNPSSLNGNASGAGGGSANAFNLPLDPLTIPDPFDPSNNVGRNCFRFHQIQTVFRNARRTLGDEAEAQAHNAVLDGGVDGDRRADAAVPALEFPLLSRIIAALKEA